MEIIVPFEINDDNLVSSSVPENEYAYFDGFSDVNYIPGQRVIQRSDHNIYENLKETATAGTKFYTINNTSVTTVPMDAKSINPVPSNSDIVLCAWRDLDGTVKVQTYNVLGETALFSSPITIIDGISISPLRPLSIVRHISGYVIVAAIGDVTIGGTEYRKIIYRTLKVSNGGVIEIIGEQYAFGILSTAIDSVSTSLINFDDGDVIVADCSSNNTIYLSCCSLSSDGTTLTATSSTTLSATPAVISMERIDANHFYIAYSNGTNTCIRFGTLSNHIIYLSEATTFTFLHHYITSCYDSLKKIIQIFHIAPTTGKFYITSSVYESALYETTLLNDNITSHVNCMYAVTTGVTHLTYTTGDDGYYVNNFNSSAPSVDGAIMYNDPDYVVGIGSIMLTSLEDRVSIFYSPIGTDPDTKVALQLSRKPSDLTADYLTDPYWVKVSPSNRYAMFDAEVNTSTTALGEIAVEVHPSETATGISFFNLVGNNLNITVTDSTDTEVYNVDVSLDGTIIATPWDWWFRTFRQKQTYVNSEFPPFYNSTIKATLTGTGEVAIGAMQVGKSEYIGMALHGTGFGCDSYSIVEREFNTTKFTRKGNAQLTNVELFVEGWRMPSVAQTLRSLIDTPATFVPTNDDRYSFMSTLGYYQTYNATIEIDGTITMEIRELS